MKTLAICAVVALVGGLMGLPLAIAADADPVVGTWQLNPAKSTFTSGPNIRSQTRIYTQAGGKISLVIKAKSADGKEVTSRTTYELNGKDFPVEGNPDYNSLSAKQMDSHTAEFSLKKDGKVIGHTRRTVAANGKTMTSTSKFM